MLRLHQLFLPCSTQLSSLRRIAGHRRYVASASEDHYVLRPLQNQQYNEALGQLKARKLAHLADRVYQAAVNDGHFTTAAAVLNAFYPKDDAKFHQLLAAAMATGNWTKALQVAHFRPQACPSDIASRLCLQLIDDEAALNSTVDLFCRSAHTPESTLAVCRKLFDKRSYGLCLRVAGDDEQARHMLIDYAVQQGPDQAARYLFEELQPRDPKFQHLALGLQTLSTEPKLIDTPSAVDAVASELMRDGVDVVGIDTETRPYFAPPRPRVFLSAATAVGGNASAPAAAARQAASTPLRYETAILQLATRNSVYIFDLQIVQRWTHYQSLMEMVLRSEKIMKLGVALKEDLQQMPLPCYKQASNILELNKWHKTIQPYFGHSSLKRMVAFYLQKRLSKSQQMSNWAQRPLTAAQLRYAGLDAYILVPLYDEMKRYPGAMDALERAKAT